MENGEGGEGHSKHPRQFSARKSLCVTVCPTLSYTIQNNSIFSRRSIRENFLHF